MSFRDTCGVSIDATRSRSRLGTCDMFSFPPCMRSIFRRIYALKIKDSVMHIVKSKQGLQIGEATQIIYIKKAIKSLWLVVFNNMLTLTPHCIRCTEAWEGHRKEKFLPRGIFSRPRGIFFRPRGIYFAAGNIFSAAGNIFCRGEYFLGRGEYILPRGIFSRPRGILLHSFPRGIFSRPRGIFLPRGIFSRSRGILLHFISAENI